MIKKTHPKDRSERRRLKSLHENASPVFKLLKEKEELDARSKADRDPPKRSNAKGLGNLAPDIHAGNQV